jgi:crotonobetainyl-CoA:carnitine CoA-transferase CaiB-like acyl-CoA transferase
MTIQMTDKQHLPGPLDGIRVVECAIWHAGPGASAILGDMGAEVIKIETLDGDPERLQKGLGAVKFDIGAPADWSFLFELSNRNKKGICIDINTQEGRAIFHQLIQSADVFLTNLRNSTKPRLGLDYPTLSEVNPKLIHASVSGFGPNGPMSDVGAFDPMGQAISGMVFLTGPDEPVLLQSVVLDQMTSIAASHAIITALFYRERHGIGQEVHVSLYSSALWLTHANLLATGIMKANPIVPWDRYKNSPLRNCFKCKDAKWIMGTNHPEDRFWPRFCELTGKPELTHDPRYADTEIRGENAAELVTLYDAIFANRSRDEWLDLFRENGFMFAPVQTLEEVLNDSQALQNEYVSDFDHPVLGSIKIPGFPVTFSKNRAGTKTPSPRLGEHTDQVLREMGYAKPEIQRLRNNRIIK